MHIRCTKCQAAVWVEKDKLNPDKEIEIAKCPVCNTTLNFKNPIFNFTIPPQSAEKLVFKLIENQTKKEYLLKIGKNIIGRNADISIENGDKFIGRKHCLIEVLNNKGIFQCIISDDGSISDDNLPSKNGTFINNSQNRISKFDKIVLQNGNTIKIGHTFFTFLAQ